jgi:excisionase family DNA binding protein
MNEQMIYRPKQAQAVLGISTSTFYRLVAAGELKLIKLTARSSGVRAESIQAFIERRQNEAGQREAA